MGAIKVHHTAVDTESAWDGPSEVAKAPNDAPTLRYMHAWVDGSGDPEAKSSYKFPHHKAGTDTPANIAGVNNALSRLDQADIPEGDKAGVRAHMNAHREDAGLDTNGQAERTANGSYGRSIVPTGDENGEKLHSYIPSALFTTPWSILPEKMAIIQRIFIRYMRGVKLNAEEVQTQIHGARRPSDRVAGSIAILPLFGTIFPRANLFTETSGATSAEMFGKRFDELIKNPDVGAILLDVDSPGGQVSGVDELSQKIFEARGSKPIIAIANHLAASAAYWIATAADELVITPSGEVGSVGVFAVHEDISQSLAQEGIKVSLISEGKYKTEANPYEPLTEEARAAIQMRVAEIYDQFIKSVARNRGVKAADVRAGFGEGRVVGAKQALALGMADRIGTLEETATRLQKRSSRPAARAQSDIDFRRRRMRLSENAGSVEPGETAP